MGVVRVESGDVVLAAQTWGSPEADPVVLVHGYPDTRAVWTLVAERLAARFHVIAYDVRGAGESTAPRGVRDYRVERLTGDLAAVIGACAPGRQIHLAGHDWGAIAGWEALADPRTGPAIATFTAICGPPLHHAGELLRSRLTRPTPSGLITVAGQLARSSYIAALITPGVPERVWPLIGRDRWAHRLATREGAPVDDAWPAPTLVADAARGANLYRANIAGRISRARPGARVTTPVLAVRAAGDPFISPVLLEGLDERYANLGVRVVPGGHWAPRVEPDLVAELIAGLAAAHPADGAPFTDGGSPPRGASEA